MSAAAEQTLRVAHGLNPDASDRNPALAPICPNCGSTFISMTAVLAHLNDPVKSCHPPSLPYTYSLPPALRSSQRDSRSAQYHPTSGHTYGPGKNTLQRLQDDVYNENRKINMYWPFPSRDDWSLGKFLVENFTQTQINAFLQLPWFDNKPKPAFSSARELLDWMDLLPSGPKWQVTELEVDGYEVEKKIQLIWRDGLDVAQSIFGNPIFGQNMTFDPIKVWDGDDREYGEWFTADEAFRIQSSLPAGATIVPIIAASDKTPVTRQTGGLEMHPLFITIGNIDSDVRMKATSHAWRCVAFMPIPKFNTHPDYQTILQSRVWHKCVDIVTANLKRAANVGSFLVDPFGNTRYCFTPVAGWTADLPEAQTIACTNKNASPITLATVKQFGDAERQPSRTGSQTLQLIHDLSLKVDPWNLDHFQKLCKEFCLIGIHLPCWRDWMNSEVSSFLLPEILHTLHKFFFDHILTWCKEVVGNDELDARYKAHHRRIGVRHFTSGVSHVKQMTGREHRDIQRTIVAMIAGAAPPEMVRSVRALMDFIYQAQRPVHTETSIRRMEASLAEFHASKDAILAAGARRGKKTVKEDFNIPKLELFLSFTSAIRNSGGLPQYTADVSERLLITHCKMPFTRTSRQRDFAEQVVRILDREERMRSFDLYLLLQQHNEPLVNAADEEARLFYTDPTMAWVSRVAPQEQFRFKAPRPFRNHFANGFISDGVEAAMTVTKAPDRSYLSLVETCGIYALPDFIIKLQEYVMHCTGGNHAQQILQTFSKVKVWYKFRVQQQTTSSPSTILPSQAVQAKPPSVHFPLGHCDAVLLNTDGQSEHNPGRKHPVAQVRVIFQLASPSRSKVKLPGFLDLPLLYVQPFEVVATPDNEPDTRLWRLKRVFSDLHPGLARTGLVIPLTEVTQAIDLVPVFGASIDRTVTTATSQEMYDEFYLNYYTDKESFDTLYEPIGTDDLDDES
ncbi:hypothetical protein JVU11DRAFT_9321 [Chiua virens]|nr:hypothetical protein JVU11DRAFT_9321 [Chiua virens]